MKTIKRLLFAALAVLMSASPTFAADKDTSLWGLLTSAFSNRKARPTSPISVISADDTEKISAIAFNLYNAQKSPSNTTQHAKYSEILHGLSPANREQKKQLLISSMLFNWNGRGLPKDLNRFTSNTNMLLEQEIGTLIDKDFDTIIKQQH